MRFADNPLVFWGVTAILLAAAAIVAIGAFYVHRFYARRRPCPLCDGCGLAAGRDEEGGPARPCPLCGGTGVDIPPPAGFC